MRLATTNLKGLKNPAWLSKVRAKEMPTLGPNKELKNLKSLRSPKKLEKKKKRTKKKSESNEKVVLRLQGQIQLQQKRKTAKITADKS